jgi:glycerol-3-phosphate acyltransferase PlsY
VTELLVAAVLAYLLGSVSFARIVGARVLPGEEIESTSYEIGGHGFVSEARGFSPGAVNKRAGARAGGIATIGDITKAVVATGVAWLVLDRDAAAAAGVGVVLGHVAPLYHRFRGAFGQSPIIGATLVLSPLGLPVAIVASLVTTVVAAEVAWVTMLWPVFLVPWGVWFADAPFTWFAVGANVLYLWRMADQLGQRVRHRREHRPGRRERLDEVLMTFRTNQFDGAANDPRDTADEPGGTASGSDDTVTRVEDAAGDDR